MFRAKLLSFLTAQNESIDNIEEHVEVEDDTSEVDNIVEIEDVIVENNDDEIVDFTDLNYSSESQLYSMDQEEEQVVNIEAAYE